MAADETDLLNRTDKTRTPLPREPSYSGAPSVEYGEDEERREKTWQRVWDAVGRKGTHLYEPVSSVPCGWLLPLLGLYLLLGYLVQLGEDAMPAPVPDAHVPADSWELFSEEAALGYLHRLLGDSPRVAGTRYHLNKTIDLKALLDDIARRSTLPVHTDWQLASGDYWLEFGSPYVNLYQNASNVVALLEGEAGLRPDGRAGPALLINCHYDSVPFAIGASDDGVFCAAMVETLSRLSRRTRKFKHNIIFLFNGAEENGLQTSHAFLSHRWAAGVTAVVNLEAAGMNGKANVFQASDARVLSAYVRRAARPSAQALGELVFAGGLVPSDTDFRIWRDFGHFHGIDMAFVKWGVVYHTRYDHPALLRPGVMQAAGDTLLPLAADLADSDDMGEKRAPSAHVYWDYLTWFAVQYGAGAALAVDLAAAAAGLLAVLYYVWLVGFRMSSVRELCIAALGRVLAVLVGAATTTLLTGLMLATTVQMRWLSEPWLVVPLYWLPYLVGATAAAHGFDAWRSKKSGLSRSIRAQQAAAGTRLLLVPLLLLLCCVPAAARARYLLSVPLILMAVGATISITLLRCLRLRAWQHLLLETALALPSVAFLMALALRLTALALPTLARSPLQAPDALAAALGAALAALVAVPVSGQELLLSRRRLWAPLGALAALSLVVALVPLSPYRDDGPATQRHHWFHSEVVSHDIGGAVTSRWSGVLVTSQDAYTLRSAAAELRRAGLALHTRDDFRADCLRALYCDLPVYRLRATRHLQNSLLIYTEGPALLAPPPALRVTSRACAADRCTLHFTMTGPAHNTLTVWPRDNVTLAWWSFASPVRPTLAHSGRLAYAIIHSTATYSDVFAPLNFTLVFTVGRALQGAPLADIAHHSHSIAHPELFAGPYRALLAAAPPYFNVASYLSRRDNYVV